MYLDPIAIKSRPMHHIKRMLYHDDVTLFTKKSTTMRAKTLWRH